MPGETSGSSRGLMGKKPELRYQYMQEKRPSFVERAGNV